MEFRDDGKLLDLGPEDWTDTTPDHSRLSLPAPLKDTAKIKPRAVKADYSTSDAFVWDAKSGNFSSKPFSENPESLKKYLQADQTPALLTDSARALIDIYADGTGFPKYIPASYEQDAFANKIILKQGATSVDLVNALRAKAGLEPLQHVDFGETFEERKKREHDQAQWQMLARVDDDVMRHHAYENTREAQFLDGETSAYVQKSVSDLAKEFLNSAAPNAAENLQPEDSNNDADLNSKAKQPGSIFNRAAYPRRSRNSQNAGRASWNARTPLDHVMEGDEEEITFASTGGSNVPLTDRDGEPPLPGRDPKPKPKAASPTADWGGLSHAPHFMMTARKSGTVNEKELTRKIIQHLIDHPDHNVLHVYRGNKVDSTIASQVNGILTKLTAEGGQFQGRQIKADPSNRLATNLLPPHFNRSHHDWLAAKEAKGWQKEVANFNKKYG